MKRNFEEALRHRRRYYAIGNESPVSPDVVKKILDDALTYVPSAFNTQSTRLVLLIDDAHRRFWNITKETLREIVPPESFNKTEQKIDKSFAAGCGPVLFFEDSEVIEQMQKSFPTYAERFPIWSQQTAAMHQLAVWTMLEDVGFGASLQHYNPLVDEAVRKEWGLPQTWLLNAQMPFGNPLQEPGEKEVSPLDYRLKIFR